MNGAPGMRIPIGEVESQASKAKSGIPDGEDCSFAVGFRSRFWSVRGLGCAPDMLFQFLRKFAWQEGSDGCAEFRWDGRLHLFEQLVGDIRVHEPDGRNDWHILPECGDGDVGPTESVEVQQDELGVLELEKVGRALYRLDPECSGHERRYGVGAARTPGEERRVGSTTAGDGQCGLCGDLQGGCREDGLTCDGGLQDRVWIVDHALRDADDLGRW